MKHILLLSTFLLFFAGFSQAQQRFFFANINAAQEVPTNGSAATGVAVIKYNPATLQLQMWADYKDLGGNISASHIHGPASPGSNAAVIYSIPNTGGTAGTLLLTTTITSAQQADLYAGLLYINVHSAAFPGGEIRGQILASSTTQSRFFTGRAQGAQETPPNNSPATGQVHAIVDESNSMIYLSGDFNNLTGTMSAGHLHNGAPTVSGGVFVALEFTATSTGVIHLSSNIGANTAVVNAGNAYVNIHSTTFGGGEIRAQLIEEDAFRYAAANINAAQEVPTNGSTATGVAIADFNAVTKTLTLNGTYTNLAGAISASHIHGPAGPGVNAAVIFSLTNSGGTSGTLTLSTTLSASQEADFLAGLFYLNIHSSSFPGGEVRGQLLPTASGRSSFLRASASSSQEIPNNASAGTANATMLLDQTSNQVWIFSNFNGLTSNTSAAHLHQAAAGVNGGVVVGLNFTNATSGTINGTGTVSPAVASEIRNGNSYLNIHTLNNGGGEIRGQFGNLVLPVNLQNFKASKSGTGIGVTWEASEEIGISYYELQRQEANGDWLVIATVTAQNNAGTSYYNYNDQLYDKTINAQFYRLRIVSVDGQNKFSAIRKVNIAIDALEIKILSNPVQNSLLRFKIEGSIDSKNGSASITDGAGRKLISSRLSANAIQQINVQQLPAGIYYLTIENNTLRKTMSVSIMK